MFSSLQKRLGQTFCCLLLLVATGCNLPMGENPPEPVAPETGFGDQTKCLDNLVPAFENYIQGTAEKSEVLATWDCIGGVVSLFEKSVRGRYEDRFTSRELANFVEQNFLENKKITDSTILEVFKVKQLLVGGSDTYISREEMGRFVKVARQVRDIAVRLNPYMRVYAFKWKINGYATLDADVKYFEAANLELQLAAKELATIIEGNGRAYEIISAYNLMKEMSHFSTTPWEWLNSFEDAIPLVQKLKKTLTGGSDSVIEPSEWRRFALLGGRGYVQYLRYFYFIKKVESVGSGPSLIYITRSIDDLFSYLGDMVEGKPEKTLTRHELLTILEAISDFIPNFHISDEFLVEAMKIKVLFFGGKIDTFEKADFDRAREKLEAFRTLTERFLSYVAVYGLSWNPAEVPPSEALAYHQTAEDNLVEFGGKLGEKLEYRYDLKDLISFAREFDKLYPQEKKEKTLGKLADEFVPVLISFKNIIFSDDDSIVGKSISYQTPEGRLAAQKQWTDFLGISGRMYARYTYYYYFLRNKEMLSGAGLERLKELVKDTSNFLDGLIKRKAASPVQQISFLEFSRLWTSLKGANFLPEKMSVKSLDALTKVAFQKFLIPPERRLMGDLPQGLTLQGVNQIRTEFSIWFENQVFLDQVYFDRPQEGQYGSAILAKIQSSPMTVGLEELKMVYSTPVALSFDDRGRLYVSKPEAPYFRKTSNLINGIRALTRLVIRSYAMDLKRVDLATGGVTVDEANTLFKDVQTFVIELGLLDPRNENFMKNRFLDANLFTAWSNGNSSLEFKEGVNLIMMLWSGIEIDSLLFDILDHECAISKPTNYKDDWLVNLGCVQQVYMREIGDKFSAMPDFMRFTSGLSPQQRNEVFMNLLKAAGYKPRADGNIPVGDLALFPQVTQYVETVFQKYDANRDGVLDTREAMIAYPTFKEILKTAAGGKLKSDKQLKGLFAWLLRYAKPPEGTKDFVKFLVWWVPKGEEGWDVRADREKLVKILGFIADSFNKTAQQRTVIPDVAPEDNNLGNIVDDEDEDEKAELREIFCHRGSVRYSPTRCRQVGGRP